MNINEGKSISILVSGAGLAGLTTALTLAHEGWHITCIDPGPQERMDRRSTAVLMPGIRLLERLGLWPGELKRASFPLHHMRLIDDVSDLPGHPHISDYYSKSLGDEPFAYNIPNQSLYQFILAACLAHPLITLHFNEGLKSFFVGQGEIVSTTDNNQTIKTKLLIGADGRNSCVRKSLNIKTQTRSYNQFALAFSIKHSQPHQGTSFEFEREHGPFTTVPCPDKTSYVVWVTSDAIGPGLAKLSSGDFAKEVQRQTRGLLGEIKLEGPVQGFPVLGMCANRLISERAVLVAEAAHVLPPIVAQGLNLSLADIATLADVLRPCLDPGEHSSLMKYERTRMPDIKARVMGVHAFNSLILDRGSIARAVHANGARFLDLFPPAKHLLMKAGLHPVGPLPSLMKPI